MMQFMRSFLLLNLITVSLSSPVFADLVIGGSAVMQFDTTSSLFQPNAGFGGVSLALDRFYGSGSGAETATASDMQNGLGGGSPLTSSGLVDLDHKINGTAVTSPLDGRRNRQSTNADIDRLSPTTSWASGERIGIDGVTRFDFGGGPFLLGDYRIGFDSLAGRLSIINNLDFPDSPAFYVDGLIFNPTLNGFDVSGELRIDTALAGFGYTVGDDVGQFTLNAVTAVPEPSSLALLGVTAVGISLLRRRRIAVPASGF